MSENYTYIQLDTNTKEWCEHQFSPDIITDENGEESWEMALSSVSRMNRIDQGLDHRQHMNYSLVDCENTVCSNVFTYARFDRRGGSTRRFEVSTFTGAMDICGEPINPDALTIISAAMIVHEWNSMAVETGAACDYVLIARKSALDEYRASFSTPKEAYRPPQRRLRLRRDLQTIAKPEEKEVNIPKKTHKISKEDALRALIALGRQAVRGNQIKLTYEQRVDYYDCITMLEKSLEEKKK